MLGMRGFSLNEGPSFQWYRKWDNIVTESVRGPAQLTCWYEYNYLSFTLESTAGHAKGVTTIAGNTVLSTGGIERKQVLPENGENR